MEHHAYESAQHTNEKVGEAVTQEILLLVCSCEGYLLARKDNDRHMDAASVRRMEVSRTKYGHHLMTLVGENADDDTIAKVDIAVRRLAWRYVDGRENDVIVDSIVRRIVSVLRGSME